MQLACPSGFQVAWCRVCVRAFRSCVLGPLSYSRGRWRRSCMTPDLARQASPCACFAGDRRRLHSVRRWWDSALPVTLRVTRADSAALRPGWEGRT
eukprot:6214195-Pleurochrysis_carterae.AAC.11